MNGGASAGKPYAFYSVKSDGGSSFNALDVTADFSAVTTWNNANMPTIGDGTYYVLKFTNSTRSLCDNSTADGADISLATAQLCDKFLWKIDADASGLGFTITNKATGRKIYSAGANYKTAATLPTGTGVLSVGRFYNVGASVLANKVIGDNSANNNMNDNTTAVNGLTGNSIGTSRLEFINSASITTTLTASFTYATTGDGTTVNFTNNSSTTSCGSSITYSWDFNSAAAAGTATPSTSTSTSPTGVSFSQDGTYAVKLTATDGTLTDDTTINITIKKQLVSSTWTATYGGTSPWSAGLTPTALFDNNNTTWWHSDCGASDATKWVIIDMKTKNITNSIDLRPKDNGNNRILNYRLEFSDDGTTWGADSVVGSTIACAGANAAYQTLSYSNHTSRYIKISSKGTGCGGDATCVTIADVKVYGTALPGVIASFTLNTNTNPVSFTSTSSTFGGATITDYQWDFDTLAAASTGTPTPATSTTANPSNISYSNGGYYWVKLVVTASGVGGPYKDSTKQRVLIVKGDVITPTAAVASTEATGACGNEGTNLGTAAAVLDGNLTTIWHSAWGGTQATCPGTSSLPQWIYVDLGSNKTDIAALQVTTRNAPGNPDKFADYEIYYAQDGATDLSATSSEWTLATSGTAFTTNPTTQDTKLLSIPQVSGRYVKLLVKTTVDAGRPFAVLAEIKVLTNTDPWSTANISKFDAVRVATEGKISFTTNTDNGIAAYQVQKQINGTFTTIATITANGTKSYAYTDKALVNGSNNYKIVVVKANGKQESTEVKGFSYNSVVKLSVYPNPAKGLVTVSFNDVKDRVITISDLSGKLVKKQVATGANTKVDVSNMPKGMYILSAEGNATKLIVE